MQIKGSLIEQSRDIDVLGEVGLQVNPKLIRNEEKYDLGIREA